MTFQWFELNGHRLNHCGAWRDIGMAVRTKHRRGVVGVRFQLGMMRFHGVGGAAGIIFSGFASLVSVVLNSDCSRSKRARRHPT